MDTNKIFAFYLENGIITFVLNHSNNQLVKLRADYQTKNGKDLLRFLKENYQKAA